MQFDSLKDLDQAAWRQRAKLESIAIYKRPSTRRNRSIEEIYNVVLLGQAAECYLIQHHGFTDNPELYKDVLNKDGEDVEVKVTKGDYYVQYVISRLNDSAIKFKNFAKIAYVFINDYDINTEYVLNGIYYWNGIRFMKRKYDDAN